MAGIACPGSVNAEGRGATVRVPKVASEPDRPGETISCGSYQVECREAALRTKPTEEFICAKRMAWNADLDPQPSNDFTHMPDPKAVIGWATWTKPIGVHYHENGATTVTAERKNWSDEHARGATVC
jgi:hypothetical protein